MSRLIILALEHGRQGGLEVIDQLAHCVAELERPSRRQLYRNRLSWFGEIVDIDPV